MAKNTTQVYCILNLRTLWLVISNVWRIIWLIGTDVGKNLVIFKIYKGQWSILFSFKLSKDLFKCPLHKWKFVWKKIVMYTCWIRSNYQNAWPWIIQVKSMIRFAINQQWKHLNTLKVYTEALMLLMLSLW